MMHKMFRSAVGNSRLFSSAPHIVAEPAAMTASSPATIDALQKVTRRVENAALKRKSLVEGGCIPRIVAVSKTKPVSAIIDCYLAGGHRHFGENYAKELLTKSTNPDILKLCPDIRWHYIGSATSSSHAKTLLKCHNLFMVETLTSIKVANLMNDSLKRSKGKEKLNVMVQINTSNEAQKGGVSPGAEAVSLAEYILQNGTHINLKGFMTIGSFDHDCSTGLNPDFVKLIETRDSVCHELNLQPDDYELSMGMSGDFEQAIELGSNNVRIGTTIFGARDAK